MDVFGLDECQQVSNCYKITHCNRCNLTVDGCRGSTAFRNNCTEKLNTTSIIAGQSGWVWLIVLLLVAASAVIGAVFLYYKRRVATLKTEILAVQYSADPQAYPDRHHFDNPVYAFQGPGPAPSSSNGGRINFVNNLVKPNNLQGQFQQLMAGGDSSGSSTASGRAGNYAMNIDSDLSMKNMDADLTNPILYNNGSLNACTSDDIDHVYDEIKYKDECKDFGEWKEGELINGFIVNSFRIVFYNPQRKSTTTWTTLARATHSSRTTIEWTRV